MQTEVRFGTRSLLSIAAVASFLSVVPLPSAFAAEGSGTAVDQAEVQARQVWRETMHDLSAPETGCFHASFPSTQWEKVECDAAPPANWSAVSTNRGVTQTLGNGADVVAQAPKGHFFSSVKGSFPQTAGVKSEEGVGVSSFGGGGILGPNEYTLQLNTNFDPKSAACDGYSYCYSWQQYLLSTSYNGNGKTEVFIQDWLENYGVDEGGANICPKGFEDAGPDGVGPGDDCLENSPAAVVYKGHIPITKLTDLELSGSVKHGGTDEVTATYGKDAYKASVTDSRTDLAGAWSDAEFNIVGNGGGSQAVFNSGSALLVKMALSYGSSSTPKCQPPSKVLGTTGETNNLFFDKCGVEGGANPEIEFIEEN